jgi:hypothetical protein
VPRPERQPGHGAIERVVDITARRVACSPRHAAKGDRAGLAKSIKKSYVPAMSPLSLVVLEVE